MSTMEGEFVSASHAGQELLGLRELLAELVFNVALPMMMELDNQAAIRQLGNEESSTRAKHIDIKLKFIKNYAKKKIVKPTYVPTKAMVADLLTKSFSVVRPRELMTLCSLDHGKLKSKVENVRRVPDTVSKSSV
uniref:AlNc14C580G12211 protein n=1 Tax=Albugo laibachii Nc14 TaxID=890382 RepID=F0X1C0_9STRA|nr:AlNc14C580G12211 [Albugo laibachii Nc14]|eukprot:CCA27596.1 AlNc14C580G12211 [Albugo laibachii Nc14]